jgi:hypothetical protein
MPDNFKQKIDRIKTVQNYIVSQLTGLSGITGVYKTFNYLTNNYNYPFICVLYMGGEQSHVHEAGNATIHFDIVIKNRLENEMDNLDYAALVATKLEDYGLNGNCIGMFPNFPKNYFDTEGEAKNVLTVITLDIEI